MNMKRLLTIALSFVMIISLASCASSNQPSETPPAAESAVPQSEAHSQAQTQQTEDVTLEFLQWWEPELPGSEFRDILDQFEAENPGIKVELISGPYTNIKQQVVIGAASGTLSDVVGMDGVWINDISKQGAVANLTELMETMGYDDSKIADQTQVNGVTYMIPVVTFAYTLFINLDLFEAAGISELPTNRTQFLDAARKVTNQDNNVYAWAIPLILSNPNGANHDIMPWIWASGGRMLDSNGNPNINNPEVKSVFELIKTMYDEKLILPGAFSMDEEDKTHEFTNGRAAMVLNTLAHITIIRESNPDLNFTIVPVPPAEGATEKYGMDYASWGISISESTTHKEEAWKLVAFLMGKDVNARLASIANALPGNIDSEPDMVAADELFAKGFEIYKSSDIINEFDGMPYSEDLQRTLNEQVQLMLDGKQSVEEALENTQKAWDNLIK